MSSMCSCFKGTVLKYFLYTENKFLFGEVEIVNILKRNPQQFDQNIVTEAGCFICSKAFLNFKKQGVLIANSK